MYPSIKTIASRLGIDSEKAKRIRSLMDGATKIPLTGVSLDEAPYAILTAINAELGWFGVCNIDTDQFIDKCWWYCGAMYVNNGETYNNTILYDVQRNCYYVTSWRDWVETFERSRGEG